jgi:integrase
MRKTARAGGDPLAERRARKAVPTFGAFADEYVTTMRSSWKNEKHADQWQMTLREYAVTLRDVPINQIDTDAVLGVLKPLWSRVPVTAKRTQGRIETVLDAAKAKGFVVGENPARWRGHLDKLLPKRQKLARGHHKALPFSQAPKFMTALRANESVAARMLEFQILTAARPGEVRGALWSEIDMDEGVWIIPAVRMKAGKEHRVPLSGRALTVLRHMATLKRKDQALVFLSPQGGKFSDMAMGKVLERMGYRGITTAHGFRSSFKDWASETHPADNTVSEMALAHVIGNQAEAAYRRGDLFEKRRKLMTDWTTFCAGGAKVVHLQQVASS